MYHTIMAHRGLGRRLIKLTELRLLADDVCEVRNKLS